MEKEEVKVNQNQTEGQSQIIAITNEYIILSEINENRNKQMNMILNVMELLDLDLERLEMVRGVKINIVDLLFDKINGYIDKRVLVISDPHKMVYHFKTYKFKTILESKMRELEQEIKREKETDTLRSILYSTVVYNYEKEFAILAHSYLPSFEYKERKKILNTVLNSLYYMDMKTDENNYYISSNPDYIILSRSDKGYEGVLNIVKKSKNYYKYLWIRSDWYDELPNAEFKIFKIKNSIIISELTPYSLLTFSSVPSN